MTEENSSLAEVLRRHDAELLDSWHRRLLSVFGGATGRIASAELREECADLLRRLSQALAAAPAMDMSDPAYQPVLDFLTDLSRSRAARGFLSSETANFVLALKRPVFDQLHRTHAQSPDRLAAGIGEITDLLDRLALHTMEVFQRSREEIIIRQQDELAELSTPVVQLWKGVLALPLIGTLDSGRTQIVMENLLQTVVSTGANIAIIDITGVPTVDTLVAQHLLKTVAAARLMGADCIISGIRPQIAQTMVHLGVELNVTTKATMADAFAVALQRSGRKVVDISAG